MIRVSTLSEARWSRLTILLSAMLAVACARNDREHVSFDSPEVAVAEFVAAVERDDTATMQRLLGPGSEGLVSSGDALQDDRDREFFVTAYRENSELASEGDASMTLVIGDQKWPFPVPLVRRDGEWYFDGARGADELVYRRIGRNELGAIAVCRYYVKAQQEYAAAGHDGDRAGIFALKLLSDEGMQNGLYWPTAEGEAPSPAGEFVAAAAAEGYRSDTGTPYHGYYLRMLYRQGGNARGGAREYFKNGILTEGFALVAWPAQYEVSGVMTFVVNQDGIVYQKDLGDGTQAAVDAMESFDPDASWTAVAQTAGEEETS